MPWPKTMVFAWLVTRWNKNHGMCVVFALERAKTWVFTRFSTHSRACCEKSRVAKTLCFTTFSSTAATKNRSENRLFGAK